jgi:alpha-1,4-digalacturonate transport system permease protein
VQFIYQTGFAEAIREYGLAAAASLVLALTLLLLTMAQLRITRNSFHNRRGSRDA